MKVLVADDDRDQLSLRCMLLGRSGFETLPAGTAAFALDLAAAHRPSCAVLDLRFPTRERGLQLIRDLKALDPALRIVVLTGADAHRLAQAPEKTLIDAIITKGSPSSALIEKLRAFASQPGCDG
ncbi:MAG: response regulator [Acidobacteriaceae bacterium]|nr:response regulator [Acidobacteriaceae bacterium]